MNSDLSNYRKSYEKDSLLEKNLPLNPIELFSKWFDEVDKSFKDMEVNAMTLSTVGIDGFPSSRIVLLKEFSEEGFVFYTNYNSNKGQAIAKTPQVCLSFFWEPAQKQVIVKGLAEKVSKEKSDSYFDSRPKGSRLGALASNQSAIIPDRTFIDSKLLDLEQKYENRKVVRPDYWGGYLVIPSEIEFWQGRSNRLHDRIKYSKNKTNKWVFNRLSP